MRCLFSFSFFLGASRRPAFLRFRTNDVLLGTLGVGVRICGVSNSPIKCSTAMLYRFFESKLHPKPVSLLTGDEQRPSIHRVAASSTWIGRGSEGLGFESLLLDPYVFSYFYV